MKQKIIAALCLLGLLMTGCVYAEDILQRGAALTVVNCQEYINLRTEPNTEAEDICGIPLYDTVVFLEDVNEKFYRIGYNGMTGYANKKYLIPSEWMYIGQKVNEEIIMTAERDYGGEGEWAKFLAHDRAGKKLWQYISETSYMTELTLISGFYAGTESEPLFMVYNSEKGLTALDLESGREIWSLSAETVGAGGSISWVVGENGTMYIGGYYSSDLVAISAEGEILWRSNNDKDVYWLYELWLTPDAIWARYEGGEGTDILYNRNTGKVQ